MYEEEDDLEEDVCQPILDDIEDCPTGQVSIFLVMRYEKIKQ